MLTGSVGSVAKRVKASFLRRPWSHDHGFNPHPGHVVASLVKTLYDDYLCLVASNKQQMYVGRSQRSTGKLGKWSTPKRVRIRPKDSATVAFSWKEDKDASINQSSGYQEHTNPLFYRAKCLKLKDIYSLEIAKLMHKIHNNILSFVNLDKFYLIKKLLYT